MRLSPFATAEVMAHALRCVNADAFSAGLNPAQWAALRYFAQTHRSARTVTAFAHHHGTTKGTASQTVAALVRKGLLAKDQAVRDRRNVGLAPTEAGLTMLAADPLVRLAEAIDGLDGERQRLLAECLDGVLRRLMAGPATSGVAADGAHPDCR